ncbi:hypothetical protein BSKO_08625 [Bryopsis sp. KO-2023]|nr:hypothetical protein BSKO_08625 [Bryopsis sp. KO-2023]
MALSSVLTEFSVSQRVDVRDIIRVAERAGDVIMKVYQGSMNVEYKSDDSPLTRADTEANEVICAELRRITPHVPIVSEELRQQPFSIREAYQYFWCVDPLDGTKEFIKRNGQFTVNIALIRKDTPILGVVHTPCQNKTHWAVEGKGAFKQEGGVETQIRCAEFDLSDPGLTLVASNSHNNPATVEFTSQFKEPNFSQLGSSLKFLLVAEGTAHAYPRLAPTMEWDTAAAHVIVTEAGGEVIQAGRCDNKGNALEDWKTTLEKNMPVVYNKQDLLSPFFVAYGKRKNSSS